MKIAYKAYDRSGGKTTGVIDAPNAVEAVEDLRKQDLFVAEVEVDKAESLPASAPAANPAATRPRGGFRFPVGKSRRLKNLAMFTRQLYVLTQAGTPLVEGFKALERQAKDNAWRAVIADIRGGVEGGAKVSESMATHPEYFDRVSRNMISAGEDSGQLPAVLNRLASLTQKRMHVRHMIRAALTYPAMLVLMSMAVMVIMLLFVIPRFGELFASLDAPIPPTTGILLSLSAALREFWWAALAGFVAAGVGLRVFLGSAVGKRSVERLLLRLPKVGGIVRSFACARIARFLGVLLDSHLPVLEALRLTRGATASSSYAGLLERAEEAVSRGESISSALETTDLVDPAVCEITRSGEQSGQIGPLLLNLADFMDEENEVTLRSLTSLIEPVILILMGAMVAFVAMSIFLPLFDASGLTGGGAH